MASDSVHSPTDSSGWARWWNRTRYQLYAPIYDWAARPLEAGRRRAIEQTAPSPDDSILILCFFLKSRN